MRAIRFVAAVAILVMAGCVHGLEGQTPPLAPFGEGSAEGSEADGSYVIGQSDELEVQVWQEPDLSRAVVVRSDGAISLPLLNDVKVEGLTVKALRELLTEKYARLVADPVVSVIVTRQLSATFYVTGKVVKPGEYPLSKRTTLLQAIATAGGLAEWAKKGSISVIRPDGVRLSVDYDEVVAGDMRGNVILQRGDTVVVP